MNKPTDYPIKTEQTESTTDTPMADMTYADLISRVAAKQPVTDEMIRMARAKLDAAHIDTSEDEQDKSALNTIRDKFRAE